MISRAHGLASSQHMSCEVKINKGMRDCKLFIHFFAFFIT